jgi:hypothetical protein
VSAQKIDDTLARDALLTSAPAQRAFGGLWRAARFENIVL